VLTAKQFQEVRRVVNRDRSARRAGDLAAVALAPIAPKVCGDLG